MIQIYLSMLDTEAERKTMEQIYEQYYSRYMYIAMKRLNNHVLAEDAIHAAFVDTLQRKTGTTYRSGHGVRAVLGRH
ncbi:hypothetical protein FACS189425_08400 [Clostridia bacterium]|nr:hypothetical protein FACS189425_08400 [Clostridia bacterium]